MLGRALTSVFWGVMADRYGRKPVIIFGTIALSVIFFYFLPFKAEIDHIFYSKNLQD